MMIDRRVIVAAQAEAVADGKWPVIEQVDAVLAEDNATVFFFLYPSNDIVSVELPEAIDPATFDHTAWSEAFTVFAPRDRVLH
jgi:hypothetical protein